MTGHRPFSDLMKDWSPERRARNEARQAEIAAQWAKLEAFQQEHDISDQELAGIVDLQQPAISKLVRRPDMKVSRLCCKNREA